ncbi:DHHC palmitoyltransferase-domain-containing protein [Dipodascopsis tothii]|uniref:DHHC palmitoyltransferase-domain-containing protein n=1 Tax=Dipodascopsis tothii TaxID=44089 RepID=UPI0034CE5F0B
MVECSAARANELCCVLAGLFPKVFVSTLLTWAAGVLVYGIGIRYFDGLHSAFVVVVGLGLYGMCLATYFQVVRYGGIGPLDVADAVGDYSRQTDLETGLEMLIPAGVLAKDNGRPRYCNKCRFWKPDRTHHCSTCQKCVLKMDHHCPWFATCVGFSNQKFFILFLTYVILFCGMCTFTSGIALLDWLDTDGYLDSYISINWVLLFLIAGIFGFGLVLFTSYHIYMVLNNKTTIETMETQKYKSHVAGSAYRYTERPTSDSVGNVFDVGYRANWEQVMGSNPWKWLLPVPTSQGKGTAFPINAAVMHTIQQRAEEEAGMLESLQRRLGRGSSSSAASNSSRSLLSLPATADDEYHGRISVEYRPT